MTETFTQMASSTQTEYAPRPGSGVRMRIDQQGRAVRDAARDARPALPGSADRGAEPVEVARATVEGILALQDGSEDEAGVAVFDVVRDALGDAAAGATQARLLVREVAARVGSFTSPRLLVNVLMATFPARAALGDDRDELVRAVEARLRELVDADRARSLVDRLR